MNAKVVIAAVLLAGVAMVPFILQRGNLNRLRAENARLESQVASLQEEVRRAATNTAPTNAVAGSPSRDQMLELMRLRAEVTALRKGGSAVPSIPANAATPEPAAGAPEGGPAPIAEGVLTTNAPPWNHTGYARPGDTMSSMVWAMQNGRMDVLLSAATSEAQAELQRRYGTSTNPVETMQSQAKKVLEVRPSALYPSNENEAYMTMVVEEPAQQKVMEQNAQENAAIPAGTVYTQGARRIETHVKLQKVGDQWRYAGAIGGTAGFSWE